MRKILLHNENGDIIHEYNNLNGKGKEFDDNGNLKFEDEYLNGKRNGNGKEFDDNDNLKFEGEYLNGKRNGKGKEYYYNGNYRFEGEYLYGIKLKGKLFINKKLEYNGEFLCGRKYN